MRSLCYGDHDIPINKAGNGTNFRESREEERERERERERELIIDLKAVRESWKLAGPRGTPPKSMAEKDQQTVPEALRRSHVARRHQASGELHPDRVAGSQRVLVSHPLVQC